MKCLCMSLCVLSMLLGATTLAAAAQPSTEDLIKAILDGKDADGELTAEVVDRTLGPLLDVIERHEPKNFAELRELDNLLMRYRAELRLRLIRIGLPEADRKLLDAYMITNPEQVTALLAAPVGQRIRTLNELPLTRDSAIGVLLVALIEDDELTIVDRAIERTRDLHDAVVARNLTRKLGDWLDRAEDDSYRPEEQPYRLLYLQFANKAADILRLCGSAGSAEVLRRGLKLQLDTPLPMGYSGIVSFIQALGELRDAKSIDLLREALQNDTTHWNGFVEKTNNAVPGAEPERVLISQQVGDVALMALLRIYGLSTEGLELVYRDKDDWTSAGFAKREHAARAIKVFEAWYAANAQREPDQREPLSKYLPKGDGQ